MSDTESTINSSDPLVRQLARLGYEPDQRLRAALELASVEPFSDWDVFLALHRFNGFMTRTLRLDDMELAKTSYLDWAKDYRDKPKVALQDLVLASPVTREVFNEALRLAQNTNTLSALHVHGLS